MNTTNINDVMKSMEGFKQYDYASAIAEDIQEYMEDINLTETGSDLEDIRSDCEMSTTGDDNGSYFCSRYKATAALIGNENLLLDSLDEFGYTGEAIAKFLEDPEKADVLIRCYLFPHAWDEYFDELDRKPLYELTDNELLLQLIAINPEWDADTIGELERRSGQQMDEDEDPQDFIDRAAAEL